MKKDKLLKRYKFVNYGLFKINSMVFYSTFILYLSIGQESTITSVLSGSKTLKLTATISGGKGDVAWQHAQIFRQSFSSQSEYPLDILVSMKEPSRNTHL